jgi:hypothetical protein
MSRRSDSNGGAMEDAVTPNARCALCGAPERRVWTPRADVPAFEAVADQTWTLLGRCAICGRYWVRALVGDTGLEPVTSCMSSKCSNQLS